MLARYLANRWIRAGLLIVLFGWGPLLAIIALDRIGLWPDANPNPIGPGMLFFVTFLPALVCLAVGVVRVKLQAARAASSTAPAAPLPARPVPQAVPLADRALLRLAVGIAGGGLLLYGFFALLQQASRGAAAAMVLGFVAVYWALEGRLPRWFGRRR